jgi:hypothetical protein
MLFARPTEQVYARKGSKREFRPPRPALRRVLAQATLLDVLQG